VVLLNCNVESTGFSSLNIDNFGGAYEMTRHLLSHGHDRIAIIKGTEGNFDASQRLRGYYTALREYGARIEPDLQIAGNFTEASGCDAVWTLLALSPRPTAIFASNDSMAVGALSAIREAGIQVPQNVALAGFDDVPIAAHLTPALTSVQIGIHNLGVRAIETVLYAVRNPNAPRKQ
jgi:LacI family transcriptional regulator